MAEEPQSSGETRTLVLCERILRYLEEHPRAADTWKGVATWWLGADPWVAPESVLAALELLAQRGQIAVRPLPSGELLFGGLTHRSGPGPGQGAGPAGHAGGQGHEDGHP